MNPVRAEGKIVRYDMIPIMEQEFGDFERECWEIFEQQYAKKCRKESLQCAKEQLTWVLEHVKKYHRTFSTIINTLINAGFSIERMIEPLPTDEILEQYPDYKDLFHKPDFLLLRVKK